MYDAADGWLDISHHVTTGHMLAVATVSAKGLEDGARGNVGYSKWLNRDDKLAAGCPILFKCGMVLHYVPRK